MLIYRSRGAASKAVFGSSTALWNTALTEPMVNSGPDFAVAVQTKNVGGYVPFEPFQYILHFMGTGRLVEHARIHCIMTDRDRSAVEAYIDNADVVVWYLPPGMRLRARGKRCAPL